MAEKRKVFRPAVYAADLSGAKTRRQKTNDLLYVKFFLAIESIEYTHYTLRSILPFICGALVKSACLKQIFHSAA